MSAVSPTTGRSAESEIAQSLMGLLRQFSTSDLAAACIEHFERRERYEQATSGLLNVASQEAAAMGRAIDSYMRGVLGVANELGDVGPIPSTGTNRTF